MNKENSYDKSYPVTTMAIQNKVTECFKSMSVDEKRILIMASPIARNVDASEQDSNTQYLLSNSLMTVVSKSILLINRSK
jgi:hypothetical protein